MSVSRSYKQDYVIGCDQILCLGGKILHKPRTPEGVAERLFMLSGKDHILYSAICVVKNENVMWSHCSVAVMKVRTLESDFIDWYVRNFSEKVKSSVGGYHFEEEGIQIFEKVKGDYFTILGIPLLPLLNFLYSKECT